MQKIKLLMLFSTVLGVIVVSKSQKGFTVHNEVVLENVEALASDERPTTGDCFNIGSILCPNGKYVQYMICNLEDEHSLY